MEEKEEDEDKIKKKKARLKEEEYEMTTGIIHILFMLFFVHMMWK